MRSSRVANFSPPCLDDVLDTLLDQEGLEVDPVDRMEGDTPLHKAVRFVNELAKPEWEAGSSLVELLLDAGADPRHVITTLGSTNLDLLASANPVHIQGTEQSQTEGHGTCRSTKYRAPEHVTESRVCSDGRERRGQRRC